MEKKSVLEKCLEEDMPLKKWQKCLEKQIKKRENKIKKLQKDIKILNLQLETSKTEYFKDN